jgi:hypothetical protein
MIPRFCCILCNTCQRAAVLPAAEDTKVVPKGVAVADRLHRQRVQLRLLLLLLVG